MCIKAGDNEIETVKNLMSMSLVAVVADALHADLDEIHDHSSLVEDLHMGSEGKQALEAGIADIFDGLTVDLQQTPTMADLLDRVVMNEFRDLSI
jgi:hypothetical protein